VIISVFVIRTYPH